MSQKQDPQKHSQLPDDRQATEFLANERTFLAWIRTSISVVSLGFVIAKFRVWMQEIGDGHKAVSKSTYGGSWSIGVGMMSLGALLSILAAWRYHVVNLQIERGKVTPDRGLIILVTVLVAVFAAAMITTMFLTMDE
jgi:putative membrane protein